MCSNYPGIKLEPALGTKKDKIEHLSLYAQVVHTTTKHVIHVAERTRTSTKCQKMKNARAKRAKLLFFIVKYGNLWGFLFIINIDYYMLCRRHIFMFFFLPLANRLYQFNSKTRILFTVEISLTPELV